MEWSKGVIFLIATFCIDGLWRAELWKERVLAGVVESGKVEGVGIPDDTVCSFSYDFLNLILL